MNALLIDFFEFSRATKIVCAELFKRSETCNYLIWCDIVLGLWRALITGL